MGKSTKDPYLTLCLLSPAGACRLVLSKEWSFVPGDSVVGKERDWRKRWCWEHRFSSAMNLSKSMISLSLILLICKTGKKGYLKISWDLSECLIYNSYSTNTHCLLSKYPSQRQEQRNIHIYCPCLLLLIWIPVFCFNRSIQPNYNAFCLYHSSRNKL